MVRTALSLRIALCCDRPDWILGEIARQIRDTLKRNCASVVVCVCTAPTTKTELDKLAWGHDLIHFLSPWDFRNWGAELTTPTVVTYHHVVDWDLFDDYHAVADSLCVTNRQLLAELVGRKSIRAGKIFRTPYGVDSDEFRPIPDARSGLLAKTGLAPNSILMGFSGKKTSDQKGRKGVERLWAVLSALRERFGERVQLLISGEGWLSGMVPECLREGVTFLGFQSSSELPAFYSGLDFYLCLSRIEGGPYPVLEAMACETAVISTPVGVVPELVVDGVNGFLVSHENHDSRIVEIVAECCADSDTGRAVRRAARETIRQDWSWERSAPAVLYEQIYGQAVVHWRNRAGRAAVAAWMARRIARQMLEHLMSR